MKKPVPLRKLDTKKVTIFKISNRRGYAAICKNNLTEGSTPYQAYERMRKAIKRNGFELRQIISDRARKLVRSV